MSKLSPRTDSPKPYKAKKIKLKTVSFYKHKLDQLISRYVRLTSNGKCYTCGLVRPKLELQCGHFISRQYNATRYDLDNLRVQCPNCNIWRRGNTAFYADNLLRELGKERFEALIARGRTRKEFTRQELIESIASYNEKLKNI